MALNVGQLLGGAGIVGRQMTERENQLMRQRDLQLQVQSNEIAADEAARLRAIRARMGEGAEVVANAPVPQFSFTPGAVIGAPPPEGTVVQPAPVPAPATTTTAPAATTQTRPAPPPVTAPQPVPPAAFRPGVRPPSQLTTVPTSQLTAEEFQLLSPTERLRRLNDLNRERLAAIDRAQLMKAPAAAGDVIAGGPYNAIAQGGSWLANQIGIPRLGRALGIYDADVTRVEIPTVGTGTATPYFDMIRQVEQANQPLTEAQLLQQMQESERTRTTKAVEKNKVDVANAPKMFADLEKKYNLPPNVLYGVMMTESRGRPGQTSSAGAQGYFQFMPETAKQYKVTVNDLGSEADGAARLLRDLLKQSNNNLEVALAKYNWGSGNFQRGGGMNGLPAETRAYIPQVIDYMRSPVTAPTAIASNAAPTASRTVAIGDSLAEGFAKANKLDGTYKTGASPEAVFKMLQDYASKNSLQGVTVYLGTGLPNNPAQQSFVTQQIEFIKSQGGIPVVFGTGPGTQQKPTTGQNDFLAQATTAANVQFTGNLASLFPSMAKTDSMGLHLTPKQYQKLYDMRPATAAVATTTTPPAQTAPPAVAVNNAVQTGTVNQVAAAASNAAPVPTPSKDGYMYGAATVDATLANPQIQQILQTRSALQRQVALFNQYGFGDKAWEAASKIQAIDLGLYKNQADLGVYEGATTGNFSRAMSVLSTFTGSPHQVLRRPDGKFDLYVNGKVTKPGLDGSQVEMLVRTQVDSEYRKQLATLQSERSMEEFKSGLRMREETNKQVSSQTLQTAREIQLEIIKGNVKLAEKKLEMAGFKATASGAGDGKVTYSNGLGDFFVIDTLNNQVEVNGVKLDVGPRAQRVAGIEGRPIWSTVNTPGQ